MSLTNSTYSLLNYQPRPASLPQAPALLGTASAGVAPKDYQAMIKTIRKDAIALQKECEEALKLIQGPSVPAVAAPAESSVPAAPTAPVAMTAAPISAQMSLSNSLSTLANQFIGWLTSWNHAPATPPATPTQPATPSTPAPPKGTRRQTDFVISSFNVLGSSHTNATGNKPGMASGVQRIRGAIQLLKTHKVDVVGFQEFQKDQARTFEKLVGKEYGVFPGSKGNSVNSIAWRKDTWDVVKKDTIQIPYFNGKKQGMPIVLLRNKKTGQEAYFTNFHNPADTKNFHHQEKWRDQAMQIQIDMVKRLEKSSGLPVFVTGDMNEREDYYNGMTKATDMHASNEGPGGKAPKKMGIDWIFGSTGVKFSGHTVDRGALVKKTTDHPMVISKARIEGN